MAKSISGRPPQKTETRVVSFRIAANLHQLLEQAGAKLYDEAGLPLNASGLARRLVVAGISGLTSSDPKNRIEAQANSHSESSIEAKKKRNR